MITLISRAFFAASLAIVCLCASPCSAQTAPDAPKPAKLRFLFLDESAGAYSLKLAKGYQQLSAAPYTISPVFTPATSDRIDLYKTNTAPDPVTGKIERVKIASFVPPTNSPSTLVVVTPRPTAAGIVPVYGVELIDSSVDRFPLGTIRILNLGRVTMAAQFSSTQVVVTPGASKIVQPTADRREWEASEHGSAYCRPPTAATASSPRSPPSPPTAGNCAPTTSSSFAPSNASQASFSTLHPA